MLRDPKTLSNEDIETIERQSLRALFVAATDFGFTPWDIFYQSNDDQKDIAEDTTREMMERLGGYRSDQRILGNVDYRKARYLILPEYATRQALFIDSKAEKSAASATLQLSQLSMSVYQSRGGSDVAERGALAPISKQGDQRFITTTLLAHYHYEQAHSKARNRLIQLTLAAVPNGRLQKFYNPSSADTIWIAGRNAPTLGEDFRVRLSFNRLKQKAPWRVQALRYDDSALKVIGAWNEETPGHV